MNIDFEYEFLDHILNRGYDYYISGKVDKVEINNDEVTAIVHGNDDYKVSLTVEDDIFLGGECSCPYNEDGEYCKHMAAVLYYLNGNQELSLKQNDDLENIINRIDNEKLKEFLYQSLRNDSTLLNKFRVEFHEFFPILSKRNYEQKIYSAIRSCGDKKYGYIDYESAFQYDHVMLEFINEAEKLIEEENYDTAFTIVSVLLLSIPETEIDDSNGSTGMIAEECIDMIFDILDNIDPSSELLKDILNLVINEVQTANLYNYGIDLKKILQYFIEEQLYLDEIEKSLELALEKSKDKSYFYSRKDYIDYLIQIYKFKEHEEKIIPLLEKHSDDESVCIMYIDELIKNDRLEDAIKILKNSLNEDKYKSNKYASKLSEIYKENKMNQEYKNMLYDIFYKYSNYNFNTYLEIKKLYSTDDWNNEKQKIIDNLKKNRFTDRILNQIYIEEKMYDDLFLNVCHDNMEYIEQFEKYLLPKYNKELLDIYKNDCLDAAHRSKDRPSYKKAAIKVNHLIHMDNSLETAKSILRKINEQYFRNRPAMLDEFKNVINNLEQYLD